MEKRVHPSLRAVREGAAMTIKTLLGWIATGLELAGVAVILGGALYAVATCVGSVVRRRESEEAYYGLRRRLGQAILLGLEFLVAGDIVGTVAIDPTFRNLGVLALIVAIRTFLSFALEVEINGRWPWRGHRTVDADTAG